MTKRQTVDVPGRIGQPNIPACVVLGDLILPSVISGRIEGQPDAPPERQIAQAFANTRAIVEAAGGTLDGIGKLTVYLEDMAHRDLVNQEWAAMFPDPSNRPARHVLQADLQGNDVIQLDVIASR